MRIMGGLLASAYLRTVSLWMPNSLAIARMERPRNLACSTPSTGPSVAAWVSCVAMPEACELCRLQRRVQQWRGIMAKKLVYAAAGEPRPEFHEIPDLVLVGADPKC